MGDRPEVPAGVMDERDGRSFGGGDVPALAQEIDLVVGVDPALQMERQMEIQEGGRRTGPGGGAFFLRGFFPRCVWA